MRIGEKTFKKIAEQVQGLMIYHGDCLDIMPTLADKSVDMILCDLP